MKLDRGSATAALAAVGPGLLLALCAGAGIGLLAATLDAAERESLAALLLPRAALLLMLWGALALGLGVLSLRAWQRWGAAPGQLAERLQALAGAGMTGVIGPAGVTGAMALDIEPGTAAGLRALAEAANGLLHQRSALRADIDLKVREASREVEQERGRLAALMSELTQSVVVCNLDGRVLLYNQRAQAQFRALSALAAGSAAPIGLGRSIYAVLERQVVAHALERVQQRLQAGAAQPSAQFVTGAHGGQLLRVQLAPVRAPARPAAGASAPGSDATGLSGFVLTLDNITHDFAEESARDQLLHGLTEGSRASLGNLLAAVEMLDYSDIDPATRERFHGVVRDEAHAMGQRIADAAGLGARMQRSRWPLEDMLGSDLLAAAARRIETLHGAQVECSEVDAALWLRVDSYALLQALTGLAGRLIDEYEVRRLRLRLAAAGGVRAHLDLVWSGTPMSTETAVSWETEPLGVAGEASGLTLREVAERHNGEFWFERERVRHEAFFRFLLPLVDPADAASTTSANSAASTTATEASRPEFYDFDLFQSGEPSPAWAERRLADLSYTVFDTETTGLDPSGGDEILQIGATRIVGGKLRRSEGYEQLVDPGRDIPAAGIPIHGITPERVAGQPLITAVLPAFHAYAADTVLVAHNAAFDLRFLQLKEAATGLRFDQPVLDTLLLSAWLHPQQDSHAIEAIAGRLGVPVTGRHTALGDAVVTAEVFLRLLPLLAERGILTLGQAREAAQQTWHARLTY